MQVTVEVMRGEERIKTITRPLREISGHHAVKFKNRFWKFVDGKIDLLSGAIPRQAPECNEDTEPQPQNEAHPEKRSISRTVAPETDGQHGWAGSDADNGCEEAELMDWHDSQRSVISSALDRRLIVDAGPGTGKTAVACARLAHLVQEEFVEPSNIWMISFTRTAVAEIRARLFGYLGDDAFGIKVATVDSHAWAIHAGHSENARLADGYDKNIKEVIDLLNEDEDVQQELLEIEHLVVDEAQDLVGSRAELIRGIIERLDPQCGISIFADEAQAIYGFAEAEEAVSPDAGEPTFCGSLPKGANSGFEMAQLSRIFRTSSPGLKRIFSHVRERVLSQRDGKQVAHADIVSEITTYADVEGEQSSKFDLSSLATGDLALFRTRAEALYKSQFTQVPHGIRVSGFGTTLPAWLAQCFFDFDELFLSREELSIRWEARIEAESAVSYGLDTAWEKLSAIAGRRDGSVDMRRLRMKLGQSKPPVEIAETEYGLPGPITGTIHASKGREANHVALFVPNQPVFASAAAEAEETRVIFVGATRARESLRVGTSMRFPGSSTDKGRAFRKTNKSTMVEIGSEGDLDELTLVAASLGSAEEAISAQQFLSRHSDVMFECSLEQDPEFDWQYKVLPDGLGSGIGYLSKSFTNGLWDVLAATGRRDSFNPPMGVRRVNALGTRTVVLSHDDPSLQAFHRPWSTSGFLLAPRLASFAPVYFRRK